MGCSYAHGLNPLELAGRAIQSVCCRLQTSGYQEGCGAEDTVRKCYGDTFTLEQGFCSVRGKKEDLISNLHLSYEIYSLSLCNPSVRSL